MIGIVMGIACALYLFYLIARSERRRRQRFDSEIDTIINSKEYKVKGKFESDE